MSGTSSRTLAGLLDERARATPDAPAVVTTTGSTTYAELAARARLVAGALRGAGVVRGDRVAVLTDNRLEWVETAFASAALGAVLTPFNTWVKTWDLDYLLEHSRPTVLVVLDQLGKQDFLEALRPLLPELWASEAFRSERFPELKAVAVIGAAPPGAHPYDDWSTSSPERAGDDAVPEDIALVLYTSGSTARPKGVPLIHGDLVDNAWEIGEREGLTQADRVFVASPLCWAFGSANAMMATLTHGATLVLQSQFEPVAALDLLEHCTAIYTLPAMTRALLALPRARERMATVRRGVTIGPSVELRLLMDELGVDLVCNIYGSTETYGNCCVTPHDAPAARRATSQGPPLPGVELRIDPDTSEVLVRGRITPGYLDASGTPLPVVDEDGWFATGDLGSLDADGWLTFAARESEMIKTAGINVSPSEVEDFLLSHPDVAEVAVAGGDDPVRGQRVVAFVRPRTGSDVSAEQLREHCAASIAGYKVPAVVRLVTAFPTTQTGKLSRKELSVLATAALGEQ